MPLIVFTRLLALTIHQPSLVKVKKRRWSVMQSDDYFYFSVSNWNIDQNLKCLLEEYVCSLYGKKKLSVSEVRFYILQKKRERENKLIDISLIPPCKSSLRFHILRINFVASIWKNTDRATINTPDVTECSWNADGTIESIQEAFPENIIEFLVDEDIEQRDDVLSDEDVESNVESDVENEEEWV